MADETPPPPPALEPWLEDSLQTTVDELAAGGGQDAPSLYCVLLIDDVTRHARIMLAGPSAEIVSDVAARVDAVLAERKVRLRCEAVEVAVQVPSRIVSATH